MGHQIRKINIIYYNKNYEMFDETNDFLKYHFLLGSLDKIWIRLGNCFKLKEFIKFIIK